MRAVKRETGYSQTLNALASIFQHNFTKHTSAINIFWHLVILRWTQPSDQPFVSYYVLVQICFFLNFFLFSILFELNFISLKLSAVLKSLFIVAWCIFFIHNKATQWKHPFRLVLSIFMPLWRLIDAILMHLPLLYRVE